ncbi:MAG: hypothetical protein M1453_08605 [Acidobacteria bacterium]|nr:hypothetical protein [Acidobacteriota bacterium]
MISILAGTVTMLVAAFALHYVAVRVEAIQMPLLRAGAVLVTLVVGVLVLVAATYFSTHLVVRLYRSEATSDPRPTTSGQ